MSKRLFAVLSVLVLASMIFAACAPNDAEPTAPPVVDDKMLDKQSGADTRNDPCAEGFESYNQTKVEGFEFDGQPVTDLINNDYITDYDGLNGFTATHPDGKVMSMTFTYCGGGFMMLLEEAEKTWSPASYPQFLCSGEPAQAGSTYFVTTGLGENAYILLDRVENDVVHATNLTSGADMSFPISPLFCVAAQPPQLCTNVISQDPNASYLGLFPAFVYDLASVTYTDSTGSVHTGPLYGAQYDRQDPVTGEYVFYNSSRNVITVSSESRTVCTVLAQ